MTPDGLSAYATYIPSTNLLSLLSFTIEFEVVHCRPRAPSMGRIPRNEIINGEIINLESRRPCVMDIRGRCLDAAFSCGPGCVTLSLSLRLSSRTDDPPAVIAAHVTNCATPQSGTVPEPYLKIIDEDNRNRNHEPAIMLYLRGHR